MKSTPIDELDELTRLDLDDGDAAEHAHLRRGKTAAVSHFPYSVWAASESSQPEAK